MKFKNKYGIITNYQTYGDKSKPAVLLIHGIWADYLMWEPQTKVLSENGFWVITPDMIWHWHSSKVKKIKLKDWDNQIIELLNYLKIKKSYFVWVSMGWVIVQHFAANNPKYVKKILISDSFGELKWLTEKSLWLSQIVGFNIFKLFGEKSFAKLMASSYKQDFAKQARNYLTKTLFKANLDQLILARKAINKIDILEKLKNSKVKGLVVVGENFGNKFIEMNRKIANAMDCKLKTIPNSMDPSNLVNPQEFNKILLKFLK